MSENSGGDGGTGGAGGGGDGGAGGGAGGGAPAGGGGTAFIDSVSPEYREAVTKAGFTSADAVVKSYLNAQSLLGNSLRIPGPDAGAEDRAKFEQTLMAKVPGLVRMPGEGEDPSNFHKQLGWPESPAGYNFEKFEGIDEAQLGQLNGWFAEVAHKSNLTQAQATALRGEWLGTIAKSMQEAQAAQDAAAEALRKEWGGSYDQRLALIGETVVKLGGDELAAELDSTTLGNSPALAKALMKVREMMGEDTAHGGLPSGLMPTADEVRAQIAEIRGNKDHAYHDSMKPGHKDAVAKMLKLQEQLVAFTK